MNNLFKKAYQESWAIIKAGKDIDATVLVYDHLCKDLNVGNIKEFEIVEGYDINEYYELEHSKFDDDTNYLLFSTVGLDEKKLKSLLVTLNGRCFDDLIAGQLDLEFHLGYHYHDEYVDDTGRLLD
jgi:hypothetical protein